MQSYKYILLGLLFLISLVSILNRPGVGNFELFNNYQLKEEKNEISQNLINTFAIYSPGTHSILSVILDYFPADPSVKLFNTQLTWVVFKITLYVSYLLTWLALLYLVKSIREKNKISFLDASIAYFASVSILLSSVGLALLDVYAAPLFVLSIVFLLKEKFTISAIFFFLALTFNWVLLVFSPLFLLLALRNKRSRLIGKVIPFLLFLVIPIFILAVHLLNINDQTQFHYILDLYKHQKSTFTGVLLTIFVSVIFVLNAGYLVKNIFLNEINFKKSFLTISVLVITLFFLIVSLPPNFLLWNFLGIFIFFYLKLLKIFSDRKVVTGIVFVRTALSIYLIFVLFVPDISHGRLFWIPLLSLILFLVDRSNFTKLGLILINVLIFMNLYTSFGTSGVVPIKGVYFNIFGPIFLSSLIAFSAWYIVILNKLNLKYKISTTFDNLLQSRIKWFLIFIAVLINLALIPAAGTGDHVSWTQYALASIEYPNPLRAYTEVVLQYPPISIVIISFFANAWKNIIGISQDYAIAIKLSIFTFYVLLVGCLLKFTVPAIKRYSLSVVDKLLIVLTTFSLIIQTQGLADINIYVVPSLFASIFFLFKKKYFLSGLMMGLTISIKWQPLILLPLFAATLFNRNDFLVSFKKLRSYCVGFILIPTIVWLLVLTLPNGISVTLRAFDFISTDNLMLSGQALNLNWVATYILHIVDPVKYFSLEHLEYLNRQIATEDVHWFLRGYLFLIAWVVIVIRYWLKQKKDIVNFLSASLMIFFSHQQLNKSAYEKHIFYVVVFMLFLYLLRPTIGNKRLLVLFDIMVIMNLVFFYGTAGQKDFNRLFFGFDITVLFSIYYFVIYVWVIWNYFKGRLFVERKSDKA